MATSGGDRATVRWAATVPSAAEQFEAKRLALVREAARAFGRRGFHNTSLEDIAETLGVTKQALYHYVRTKHEILFAAKMAALDLVGRAAAAARAASKDPLVRLRIYIETYVELMTGELGSPVLAEPVTTLPPEYREPVMARLREADVELRRMVQDCIDAGAIPPCDPHLAVAFFMGAINHIARWYAPDGPLSGRQIGAAFSAFVLHGIAGAGDPAADQLPALDG